MNRFLGGGVSLLLLSLILFIGGFSELSYGISQAEEGEIFLVLAVISVIFGVVLSGYGSALNKQMDHKTVNKMKRH